MFVRMLSMIAICFCLASQAQAHSVLVSSDPALNAVVETGARSLKLVFDSRVDPKRSRLFLALPDGSKLTLTPDVGDTKGTLLAAVDLAAPGKYILSYEVLSIDGHIARGFLPFSVAAKQ